MTEYGPIRIEVLRDRDGSFEPLRMIQPDAAADEVAEAKVRRFFKNDDGNIG